MEPRLIRVGKKILPQHLHKSLKPLGQAWRDLQLFRQTIPERLRGLRWKRRHTLPGELIVSLTSYPPRFPSLHRTLRRLLRQTVRPDRIILWIAHQDMASLPPKVTRLRARGLEIRATEDIGSHKKLVPALREFPDAFIVTADDDIFYAPDWLHGLVAGFDPRDPSIICTRAHRPLVGPEGAMACFRLWEKDVQDDAARRASLDIIPTGCGGVLYYPGALHPGVLDQAALMKACPTADDFWFYWMARRQGSTYRKVGSQFRYIDWPESQGAALHRGNLDGGYDRQLAALITAFPITWTGGQIVTSIQAEEPACAA